MVTAEVYPHAKELQGYKHTHKAYYTCLNVSAYFANLSKNHLTTFDFIFHTLIFLFDYLKTAAKVSIFKQLCNSQGQMALT